MVTADTLGTLRPCLIPADEQLAALKRLHRKQRIDWQSPDAELLVRSAVGLVLRHVQRFARYPSLQDDLLQAGLQGVMRAIRTFDVGRGCKFSTHCDWQIRGSISDEMIRQRRQVARIERASEICRARVVDDQSIDADEPEDDPQRREIARAAVRSLPGRHRLIAELAFGLRTGKRMKTETIARRMSLEPATVVRSLKRSVQRMRRIVREREAA